MFVKDRMTRNPYTVQMNANINELIGMMRDKNLTKVPVLDGDKLVGIVTSGDINQVSPTKATSLSVFEINYLLSKTTVKDAMTKSVFSISPEDLIEEAAVRMRANRVNTLPVVEDGKVVGIVTESDLFDALIDILGARERGTRFVVTTEDKPRVLAEVGAAISDEGVNIVHLAVNNHPETKSSELIFRVETLEIEPILQKLENMGYQVSGVIKNRG